MPPSEQFRGVSLGGWFVYESFITPYLFTLTDCDVEGIFYDATIGNRKHNNTDTDASSLVNRNAVKVGNETKICIPLETYPVDTWTLTSSFPSKDMARNYLRRHWDTFVTKEDIRKIANAGLNTVKIPIGHWILGDIRDDEPWVDGEWPYFVRAVRWCRQYNLKVVADIHTSPGSQNGFDNSGQFLFKATALHWSSFPFRVSRSVKAVGDVARALKEEGIEDTVTGIEILNEIYSDVNITVLKQFYDDSFAAVREHLPNAIVIASDAFDAGQFNGFWDDIDHKNTLLDTHLYTVFSEKLRSMSPKQHIAFVCGKHYDIELNYECCWGDNQRSIGRIVGEWTASYDTLVAAEINFIFAEIARTGLAPKFHRTISSAERKFLRNYVEAQMVVYEGAGVGVTNGWFYWNAKMEGGAFAEWDLLRGVEEGWFPVVDPTVPSRERYGSCEDLIMRTKDDYSIVREFPDPKDLPPELIEDRHFDDDIVMTHGLSLELDYLARRGRFYFTFFVILAAVVKVMSAACKKSRQKKRHAYLCVPDATIADEIETPPLTPE